MPDVVVFAESTEHVSEVRFSNYTYVPPNLSIFFLYIFVLYVCVYLGLKATVYLVSIVLTFEAILLKQAYTFINISLN